MVPLGYPEVKGVFLRRQMNKDRQGMKRDRLVGSISQDPWK